MNVKLRSIRVRTHDVREVESIARQAGFKDYKIYKLTENNEDVYRSDK